MLRLVVLVCVVGLALGTPATVRTREEIEEYRRFLENSRTDDGIRLDSRMLTSPEASVWENSGKYQGDIILDDWQVDALVTDFAAGRAAYIWPNTKWPGNMVVYDFAPNAFNSWQQQGILNAITWIQQNSCVRFRRRTSNDRDYVLLTGKSDGCYASVGFWAGRGIHTMNLASGCFLFTIIIHEWMHVLGFFHMQSTHNRDNYVRINFENIIAGTEFNFERYGTNMVSNLDLPYEYTSTMHYTTHAFTRNGLPTITALRSFTGVMGQMQQVTALDWLRLRRHYNCAGAWNSEQIELLQQDVEQNSAHDFVETPIEELAPEHDETPVEELVPENVETEEQADDVETPFEDLALGELKTVFVEETPEIVETPFEEEAFNHIETPFEE